MTAPKTPMEALGGIRLQLRETERSGPLEPFGLTSAWKLEILHSLRPFIGVRFGGEYTDKPSNVTDAELDGLAAGKYVVVPKQVVDDDLKQAIFNRLYEHELGSVGFLDREWATRVRDDIVAMIEARGTSHDDRCADAT